jgi:hypothetical protein
MFVTRYSFGTLPQIITLLFFDPICKEKRAHNIELMGQNK